MNFELYREIWELKFEDDLSKHQDKNVDGVISPGLASVNDVFDEPFAAFRTDLARHKLVWTGNFCSDLWFYIKNSHPLLSICLSDKAHPLGRWERLFIELFIFALASMWAASVVSFMTTTHTDSEFWDRSIYYGYSMLGGVVKMVVNGILKAAATCTGCQEEGTRMRKKWERCGYVCMAIWAVISAGLLGLAGWFVHKNGEGYWAEWLESLAISYAFGWLFSLVLTVVLFTLMFNCCKKNDKKFGFIVTYQDYVRWKDEDEEYVGHGGGRSMQKSPYAQVSQDEVDVEVVKPIDI